MIRLAVSGCQGRMGQRITQLALADQDFKIVTLLERPDHPGAHAAIGGVHVSSTVDALKGADVLIEFTTPEATLTHAAACVKHGVKMVIGTTGLNHEQKAEIKKASAGIPIVFSSNMSVGVNIFLKLAQMLAEKTPSPYTVKIIEAHHIHKKDAPSGTAKTIAEVIESASSKKVQDIQAIREGEIIGDHKVIFESPDDTIMIDHHAKNRDIFAKGALVAAKFLENKKSGLYTMQDVLKLSE